MMAELGKIHVAPREMWEVLMTLENKWMKEEGNVQVTLKEQQLL